MRVREITDKIPENILDSGLCPVFNLPELKTVRYPRFVYSDNSFSFYGMLSEMVFRAGLSNHFRNICSGNDIMSTNVFDIIQESYKKCKLMYGNSSSNYENIDKQVGYFTNMIKDTVEEWKRQIPETKSIIYNYESKYKHVLGHPDIITDTGVLDCKNSSKFSSMSHSTFMQLLFYTCIMREEGRKVDYIGIVLTMQRKVLKYDVSKWDHRTFLYVIMDSYGSKQELEPLPCDDTSLQCVSQYKRKQSVSEPESYSPKMSDLRTILKMMNGGKAENVMTFASKAYRFFNGPVQYPGYLGGHISKGKNIKTTLKNHFARWGSLPCQVFLRNPRTGKIAKKTLEDSEGMKEIVGGSFGIFYVHAPYVINLCKDEEQDEDKWNHRILKEGIRDDSQNGRKRCCSSYWNKREKR